MLKTGPDRSILCTQFKKESPYYHCFQMILFQKRKTLIVTWFQIMSIVMEKHSKVLLKFRSVISRKMRNLNHSNINTKSNFLNLIILHFLCRLLITNKRKHLNCHQETESRLDQIRLMKFSNRTKKNGKFVKNNFSNTLRIYAIL